MIRRAFILRLKDDALPEYKHHHDNIWPDFVAEIERSGIASITIFEKDPLLFLFSEIHDKDAWDKLWATEIYDRWAKVMEPLMYFNEDGTVEMTELNEIFRVESGT